MSLLKRNRVLNRTLMILVASGGVLFSLQVAHAAESEQPPYPQPILPAPMSDNDVGFQAIFDGKTLRGWDGDRTFWRVENGAIVGETTKQHPLSPESGGMLIWRGGAPADFELKLEYRISPMGNSGIQYRSSETPWRRWGLRGYQADIDGAAAGKKFYEEFAQGRGIDAKRITGMNYHEWGRTFLALPGQLTYVGAGEPQRMLASLGDGETLADAIRDDWNSYHLIVRGNVLIHIVNGRVTSMVIDDDTAKRRMDGLLGLQIHEGSPMKVEFRHIRLKAH